MPRKQATTLGEIGEWKILNDYVLPHFRMKVDSETIGPGDDAAVTQFDSAAYSLVSTVDPCPVPVMFSEFERDYRHYGRLAVVISASDIAAMGGRVRWYLVSADLPERATVVDLKSFISGLEAGLADCGGKIVGGNIRSGKDWIVTTTALGEVPRGRALRRSGASPGDHVYVGGHMGRFLAAVAQRLSGRKRLPPDLADALERPTPAVVLGPILAEAGLATSAVDASDGVAAAVASIASSSGHPMLLDLDAIPIPDSVDQAARASEIDPAHFLLGWGNWEIVFTVSAEAENRVVEVSRQLGFPVVKIGHVEDGAPGVHGTYKGKRGLVIDRTAEKFTPAAAKRRRMATYLKYLRNRPVLA